MSSSAAPSTTPRDRPETPGSSDGEIVLSPSSEEECVEVVENKRKATMDASADAQFNIAVLSSSGHHSLQGVRPTMEDDIFIRERFKIPESGGDGRTPPRLFSFYAVFDGHGGKKAAEFSRDHMFQFLCHELTRDRDPAVALNTAFLRTDTEFIQSCQKDTSGTTAVVLLLDHVRARCWVAHVGDSRAVLCRSGRAVPLTRDHKADRPDELARIMKAGGFVINNRLMGNLAISRAIGDADFKENDFQLLLAEPEVAELQLNVRKPAATAAPAAAAAPASAAATPPQKYATMRVPSSAAAGAGSTPSKDSSSTSAGGGGAAGSGPRNPNYNSLPAALKVGKDLPVISAIETVQMPPPNEIVVLSASASASSSASTGSSASAARQSVSAASAPSKSPSSASAAAAAVADSAADSKVDTKSHSDASLSGGSSAPSSQPYHPGRLSRTGTMPLPAGAASAAGVVGLNSSQASDVDEFVVLACDGVFDVMSNDAMCNFVRDAFAHKKLDAAQAAEALAKHSLDTLRSRDNVTAIVVRLSAPPS